LRHHSHQLRGGLDQQHAGENRFARKMAAQKWLVAANFVFGPAALPGSRRSAIQETEFRPVRQKTQRFLHHLTSGSVTL
jgi:hypothetical protein